jgi:FMN phosphatase YigB (HAD superfamily)
VQRVAAVIVDLDNTLYDWVTFFSEASTAMAAAAARELGTTTDAVLAELKAVHQRYGDSEYPFALLETAAVSARWGSDRQTAKRALQRAFGAFNEARERILKLYPGTLVALTRIRSMGCPVVAHTEASVVNAAFRLRKLGVLPHLSRLYALEHFGLEHPEPERSDPVQRGTDTVRIVPRTRRKPDPDVLRWICEQETLVPHEVVYVGDSIARDIGMAKAAGCWAAWAKYGTAFSAEAWQRLVGISHWTREDVARAEKAQREFGSAMPDVVLESSLEDLFKYFEFTGTSGGQARQE